MGSDWYAPRLVPMSHAGPTDGDVLNRQITGQKQQSGGWNLGAVALPALAVSVLLYTVVMLEQKEEVKRTRSASEACR